MEALNAYEQVSEQMSLELFAVALLVSLFSSFAAAGMYRMFYETRATGSQVSRSFPLLGLSITTLFVCIQLSIPLSLGLLGSLSIIRFRTPIKEPEEVGFIMLVIAASVAAATYNFAFLVILYLLAFLALVAVRAVRHAGFLQRDGLMVLTLNPRDSASVDPDLDVVLRRHFKRHAIQSVTSQGEQTSMQITFSGLKSGVMQVREDLGQTLSVTGINLFLERPSGLR